MRKFVLGVGVLLGAVPMAARGAMIASDNASNYTSTSWPSSPAKSASNLGAGFGTWNLSYGNGSGGYFLKTGSASNIATGGSVFDTYAYTNGYDVVTAGRAFTADPVSGSSNLSVGQTFLMDFASTGSFASDGTMGVTLEDAADDTSSQINVNFAGSTGEFALDNGAGPTFGTLGLANLKDGIQMSFTVTAQMPIASP